MTAAWSAPFCGPNPFVAPRRPSNGLSTSVAATISTPSTRAGLLPQSTRATSRSPAPPRRSTSVASLPSAAVAVAPSAASSPAPASLVAEPPSPTTMRRAPASTAAASSSPTPYVVVARGSRCACGTQVQAAGLGALDVRRGADHEHRRRNGSAERAGHREREQVAAERGVQHVEEPGAAVGERHLHDHVVRRRAPPALGDRRRSLDRAQRARELVRRDQDLTG